MFIDTNHFLYQVYVQEPEIFWSHTVRVGSARNVLCQKIRCARPKFNHAWSHKEHRQREREKFKTESRLLWKLRKQVRKERLL